MPNPNDNQVLNLEELKMDPRLWLRLTTPLDNSGVLGNVFTEKENPFLKTPEAAMAKIEKLAGEGKLFLRDKGRSRHFHEVKMDEDGLKIGDQREMKFGNRHADPALRVLMWFSKHFFKGIGWNGVSNWFEERLKRASETIELNEQYKKEYKEMGDTEKKQLKALRKHEKEESKALKQLEKNLKKLEKIKKEVEKTQQALDKIQGKTGTNSVGEMPSPLNDTPPVNQEQTSMQPTHLGDNLHNKKDITKLNEKDDPVQEDKNDKKVKGEDKGKEVKKDESNDIVVNNIKISAENIKQLPEIVQSAFKVIVQFIEQQKAIEQEATRKQDQQTQTQKQEIKQDELPTNENTQQQQQETTNNMQESLLIEDDNEIEQGGNREHDEIKQEDEQITTTNPDDILIDDDNSVNNADLASNLDLNEQANPIPNNDQHTNVNTDVNQAQIPSPLSNPANLEPEKISIQPENNNLEATNLEQRLAAEKQSLDAITNRNWREFVTNSLLSHDDAKQMREQFESIKDDRTHHSTVLTSVLFGVLTNDAGGPESKQRMMDTFLNGQSLGPESNKLINESIENYNSAVAKLQQGNKEDFEALVTNAVLELGQQASREKELSPRHVVIAQMISNAVSMKNRYELTIAMNDDQMQMVQGASEMGKLAKRYFQARQFFGKQPMDMTKEDSRVAMADLLAGTAVNSMLRADHDAGEIVTKTQMMMGKSPWSASNIRVMASCTQPMKDITQEQLQNLLENPLDFKSAMIGNQVSTNMIQESIAIQNEIGNADLQKDMNMNPTHEQLIEQQPLVNMPFN